MKKSYKNLLIGFAVTTKQKGAGEALLFFYSKAVLFSYPNHRTVKAAAVKPTKSAISAAGMA